MKLRAQQYRLQFPLNAEQVEHIDTLFETLYRQGRELEAEITALKAALALVTRSTSSPSMMTAGSGSWPYSRDGEDGEQGPPGPSGSGSSGGSASPAQFEPYISLRVL